MLRFLVKSILNKHKPTVIAVIGDGQTSIGRDVVYKILKSNFDVKRSFEIKNNELSISLAILNYTHYQETSFELMLVIIKMIKKLFVKNPRHYFLILKIVGTTPKMLNRWLKIVKPEVLLIVGKTTISYDKYNIKKLIKISSSGNSEVHESFDLVTTQIGKFYDA